ncbi:hypothetical protein GCM10009830_01790 [Glycomyces endophyticus]|uniref:Trypsin-like peptidase domain-containing protein n=1 Tax=Glycomyces endophyticus TaxID=480996 RepID=A0ABN2FWL2_9ACTN
MAGRINRRAAAAVKIRITAEDGSEALIGSGHLVDSGLVLTAGHVLDHLESQSDATRLRVRGRDKSFKVTGVIRFEGLDAAALLVPRLGRPSGRHPAGSYTGDRPLGGCSVVGFPEAGAGKDQMHPEYLEVSVLPVVDDRSPRLALAVHSPLPVDARTWAGISGAGILDPDGHLLGIVTHVPLQWNGRLHGVPIESIMRGAATLATRLPAAGMLADLPLVVNTGEDPLIKPVEQLPAVSGADESLFELLHYRNHVVPFVAEGEANRIIADALRWARSGAEEPDLSVMVLTGPAGTGKSRLAAEVCDRLARADRWWRTGFVDYAELATVRPPTTPLLAVCDYPERQAETVGAFLSRVTRLRRDGVLQAPVRVMLVARSQGEWFERIRDHAPNIDRLVRLQEALPLGGFGSDVRHAHAQQAFGAFALRFGTEAELPPGLERYDRPLTIHAAALMAAAGETLPDPSAGDARDALLRQLIRREGSRWASLTDSGGHAVLTDHERGMEALCVATLTAPYKAHLVELLRAVPSLADASAERRTGISDALHELYPGSSRDEARVAPVEPDLIAAHLLAHTGTRSEIVRNLVDSTVLHRHPAYHARLVHALLLAADEYPVVAVDLSDHLATSLSALTGAEEHVALAELLESSLPQLVAAAVRDVLERRDLTAARHLVMALDLPHELIDSAVAEHADDILLAGVIPSTNPALAGLGSALANMAVHYWRQRYAASPESEAKARLADSMAELGVWQELDDRHTAAHVAKQRAMDLYEQLAGDDEQFIPDLARAVNNFSIATSIAGETDASIHLTQRAIELWQYSDEALDGDFRDRLALARANLSFSLLEAYRPQEALVSARRAERSLEELCGDDPDEYLPELQRARFAHAASLAGVGRAGEAVVLGERAVALGDDLVRIDRTVHLPRLARAVEALGRYLESAGRPREALAPKRRAVRLWLEATERMPGAYMLEHVEALGEIASYFARAGRRTEALEASDQAVDVAERRFRLGGGRCLPVVAVALETATAVRLDLNADLTNALYFAGRVESVLAELDARTPGRYAERLALVRDAQRQIHRRLARTGDQHRKWGQP